MDNRLFEYLRKHQNGAEYYGKIKTISDDLSNLLAHITRNFSHYTSHGLDHSEEIINQITFLLFKGDKTTPDVKLSAVEVYVIACAAYFHDVGMVVSDKEFEEILNGKEWKEWIKNEPQKNTYEKLQKFESEYKNVMDKDVFRFIYSRELRLILSEFIRTQHHLRVDKILEPSSQLLSGFDFGEPILRNAIINICKGHGLNFEDLNDDINFSQSVQIRGENANIKLMAILLRLGDLLDLRCKRSCSSILSVLKPLPIESELHHKIGERKTHFFTSPDKISLHFRCDNHNEHRVIEDWCSWIKSECEKARNLPKMERHDKWMAPVPEIKITPSEKATYIPGEWRFIFDEEKVVQQLINDVHANDFGFVYELIQNALDAMRCKLYSDLVTAENPESRYKNPWSISNEIRERYVLKIKIESDFQFNPISEKNDEFASVSVEDSGIGMNEDVINNYFLQIGRSYYTTKDFEEKYPFYPISKYGIGFLSVFSVSNFVEVETLKGGCEPVKLTLTGPKKYLLKERSTRKDIGTSIKVRVKKDLIDDMYSFIKRLCTFVEFPIEIDFFGRNEKVRAEKPDDIKYSIDDQGNSGCKFSLLSFPLVDDQIYGSIYVLSYDTPNGQDWTKSYYARHRYPELHPGAPHPILPNEKITFNGLGHDGGNSWSDQSCIARIDYRGKLERQTHEKNIMTTYRKKNRHANDRWQIALNKHKVTVLKEHLAQKELALGKYDYWKYLQGLVEDFWVEDFWDALKGTVRLLVNGNENYLAVSDLREVKSFTSVVRSDDAHLPVLDGYWIDMDDKHAVYIRSKIFKDRYPFTYLEDEGKISTVLWTSEPDVHTKPCYAALNKYYEKVNTIYFCNFGDAEQLFRKIFKTIDSTWPALLLNAQHPMVKWLAEFSKQVLLNHSAAVDNGIKRLFNVHFKATLFSPFTTKEDEYDALVRYYGHIKTLEGFPAVSDPPFEALRDGISGRRHYMYGHDLYEKRTHAKYL